MMKLYKLIIVLLVASLIFFLASCKKQDEIITKELTQEKFSTVVLKSGANVSISYGENPSVLYKGTESQYDNIIFKVENGKMTIDSKANLENDGDIEYIITIPTITNIDILGTSKLILNEFKEQDHLILNVKGEGNIKVNKFSKIKDFKIIVSGKATIEMLSDFGKLENLKIDASGEIDYKGYLLKANNCKIDFKGTGTMKIWAINSLSIDNSGSGKIFYKGNPDIKSNYSGTGILVNQN